MAVCGSRGQSFAITTRRIELPADRPITSNDLLTRAGLRFFRAVGTSTEYVPQALLNRAVQLALDATLTVLAIFIAYQLRFDGAVPEAHRRVMWSLILLLPFVRPLLMLSLGAYDAIWRYFNLRDATVLALSACPPSVALLLVRYLIARRLWGTVVPASVIVSEFGLYLGFASLLRILRRVTYEATRPATAQKCRALLVGTDGSLPNALRHLSGSGEIQIVGLLAPEEKLLGMRIGGFLVMEKPEALPRLLVSQDINLILIADAGPSWIGEVVATAAEFGVEVRLLPSAANVIRGDVRVQARASAEVALSRTAAEEAPHGPAPPHVTVIENFRDRAVLITGAGGSIGSELARQVAALPVSSLILLDRDENSIFELTNNLAALTSGPVHIDSVVADIRDAEHLRVIFEKYRPHIVLHAAAYKHVPVMEANASEAVLNNVTGTRLVAAAALNYRAERFVMISTDKAVRPSSVMGATKRLAEMLVSQQAQEQTQTSSSNFTRIACVRFGNVVGSRGSVVPIFLQQIADGGPITITDEHMTRYFMTIPEAAQLVLQAASLASNGDIYMLDMGDAVKITNLAKKLIELSGLRPEKDIEIRFVGSRPGEKITEQLWHTDALVEPTDFPRVFAVKADLAPDRFSDALSALEQAALSRNETAIVEQLRSMPIGFAEERALVTASGASKPRTISGRVN